VRPHTSPLPPRVPLGRTWVVRPRKEVAHAAVRRQVVSAIAASLLAQSCAALAISDITAGEGRGPDAVVLVPSGAQRRRNVLKAKARVFPSGSKGRAESVK